MEEEIEKLKLALQSAEDVDLLFMDEEMKELRHYVFFTHSRMEESLGLMLTRENLKDKIPQYPPYSQEQQSMIYAGTVTLIEDKYSSKVKDAATRPIIDNETEIAMNNVNGLRNAFGHSSIPKYRDRLIELKADRTKYKEALEQLLEAHRLMNEHASKSLRPSL